MAAPHAIVLHANPCKHVAAKAFDQGKAFPPSLRGINLRKESARGQVAHDLLDQAQALLHFADTQPDARIHVAVFKHWNVEFEHVVGGVTRSSACVESAAAGAADAAAGTELARQGCRKSAGRSGAILQRG